MASCLVQELQARVVAQGRRDDRQREVAGERRVDLGAHEVREPQDRDRPTSGRRRPKSRAYCSTSMASFA